jgi:hypothetical protein
MQELYFHALLCNIKIGSCYELIHESVFCCILNSSLFTSTIRLGISISYFKISRLFLSRSKKKIFKFAFLLAFYWAQWVAFGIKNKIYLFLFLLLVRIIYLPKGGAIWFTLIFHFWINTLNNIIWIFIRTFMIFIISVLLRWWLCNVPATMETLNY